MRILAIETSTRSGEVALLLEDKVVAKGSVAASQRLTASLVPTIQEVLSRTGWRPTDVDLVAVDIGPGSFMGTRIGLTAAKTFAYAVGCELVPVASVDVVAHAVSPQRGKRLRVGFDAARGQVFVGQFEASEDGWKRTSLEIEALDAWLGSSDANTILSGPMLTQLKQTGRLPEGATLAPEPLWRPHAEHVGLLALQAYRSGHTTTDYWLLEPLYLRPSAAEEKLGIVAEKPPPVAGC